MSTPTRTATRALDEGGAGKTRKRRPPVTPAEVKRQLRIFVAAVEFYVSQIDALMQRPVTDQREFGQRLAHAINQIDIANQCASRYGLGRRSVIPELGKRAPVTPRPRRKAAR